MKSCIVKLGVIILTIIVVTKLFGFVFKEKQMNKETVNRIQFETTGIATGNLLPAQAGDAAPMSNFTSGYQDGMYIRKVHFIVIATDVSTGVEYDVTGVSHFYIDQVFSDSANWAGAAQNISSAWIWGGQQDIEWAYGEMQIKKLTTDPLAFQVVTPAGSKGFTAGAGGWTITVRGVIEIYNK